MLRPYNFVYDVINKLNEITCKQNPLLRLILYLLHIYNMKMKMQLESCFCLLKPSNNNTLTIL